MARFEAIMLGADGKAIEAKGLKWEVLRLDQRWQWYSRDGTWNYESATQTRRVAAGAVDAAGDKPAVIETRLDWGRYRLEVSASDGSDLISSTVFNAGYWADEGADTPETLDVALDKPAYQIGETARVKVTSRSGGRALIAVAQLRPWSLTGGRSAGRRLARCRCASPTTGARAPTSRCCCIGRWMRRPSACRAGR
jgi:uncharacterized protein YfaS (alpha-2-macroglobulin family)